MSIVKSVRLPISDTFKGVYPENVFLRCIVENEQKTGIHLSEFHMSDSDRGHWKEIGQHVEFEETANGTRITKTKRKDTWGLKCRQLKSEDELVVRVDYLQYSSTFASASLFLTNQNQLNYLAKNETIAQLQYSMVNGAIVHKSTGECIDTRYRVLNMPFYLKMCYKENCVTWYISEDGETYIECGKDEIQYKETLSVGMFVTLDCVDWFPWLATNSIHMKLDLAKKKLDYYWNVGDETRSSLISQFLNYKYVDTRPFDYMNIDALSYITTNLCYGRYLSLTLQNELGRVLLYGYDAEKELFYILYHEKMGKWKTGELTYKEMLENRGEILQVLEYEMNREKFTFDTDIFLANIKDFLHAADFQKELDYIIKKPKDTVYGVRVYNAFIENHQFITPDSISLLLERIEDLYFLTDYLEENEYIEKSVKLQCKQWLAENERLLEELSAGEDIRVNLLLKSIQENEICFMKFIGKQLAMCKEKGDRIEKNTSC